MQNQLAHDLSLHLGDNTLILAQRLSEWCGHGPVLEQDIALTNMALDLLGHARMYLTYAAELEGKGRTEDDLAYFRDAHQYRNMLIVEYPNTDWAYTIARQFFFDVWHYYYVEMLGSSSDPQLAAIAQKAFKEVRYHLRFSSDWVLRLGDGTPESHQRIQTAVQDLSVYTGELITPVSLDLEAHQAGIGPDLEQVAARWKSKVTEVLQKATLQVPDFQIWMQKGGKTGQHTEYLGFILAEMQHLQRTYPGQTW
jgi:ring-1,2-phenylacetyl-CoA epoxidase subunit PaaC